MNSLIVNEEICPSQLLKYGAEHSSSSQRANFVVVDNEENENTFDGHSYNSVLLRRRRGLPNGRKTGRKGGTGNDNKQVSLYYNDQVIFL